MTTTAEKRAIGERFDALIATYQQAQQLAGAGEYGAALAELHQHSDDLVAATMKLLAAQLPQAEIASALGITQQAVSKRWPRRG